MKKPRFFCRICIAKGLPQIPKTKGQQRQHFAHHHPSVVPISVVLERAASVTEGSEK